MLAGHLTTERLSLDMCKELCLIFTPDYSVRTFSFFSFLRPEQIRAEKCGQEKKFFKKILQRTQRNNRSGLMIRSRKHRLPLERILCFSRGKRLKVHYSKRERRPRLKWYGSIQHFTTGLVMKLPDWPFHFSCVHYKVGHLQYVYTDLEPYLIFSWYVKWFMNSTLNRQK